MKIAWCFPCTRRGFTYNLKAFLTIVCLIKRFAASSARPDWPLVESVILSSIKGVPWRCRKIENSFSQSRKHARTHDTRPTTHMHTDQVFFSADDWIPAKELNCEDVLSESVCECELPVQRDEYPPLGAPSPTWWIPPSWCTKSNVLKTSLLVHQVQRAEDLSLSAPSPTCWRPPS